MGLKKMLKEQYTPEEIESNIQSEWEKINKYKATPDDREKLPEFFR